MVQVATHYEWQEKKVNKHELDDNRLNIFIVDCFLFLFFFMFSFFLSIFIKLWTNLKLCSCETKIVFYISKKKRERNNNKMCKKKIINFHFKPLVACQLFQRNKNRSRQTEQLKTIVDYYSASFFAFRFVLYMSRWQWRRIQRQQQQIIN